MISRVINSFELGGDKKTKGAALTFVRVIGFIDYLCGRIDLRICPSLYSDFSFVFPPLYLCVYCCTCHVRTMHHRILC